MNQYPYELLIRMSPAGVAGVSLRFAADQPNPMSQQLQTYVGEPRPLAAEDLQAGQPLAIALGVAATAALAPYALPPQ
ncbi:hypothetical protein BI347_18985 [Chromobacterium sphagni]|uniref:Uncharacterized protein n=1 Tax=Chromobacterium sphagni TaxID=1903179 RepID=A0A1S1WU48_9NEIS|nr:hypothetical protein [Chromobacterium sphagni]OHX10514.1 hypothetical protein BI347_22320 [Chromobacterium sphagni]OHX10616.1 hypothetical protein BI347_18985 [Chromobacterium sphagni]